VRGRTRSGLPNRISSGITPSAIPMPYVVVPPGGRGRACRPAGRLMMDRGPDPSVSEFPGAPSS
jgi:hypothetical protein